ncbi:MAG TPA: hypothetical protein VE912_18025 [Bacteroidales bacterium]|nr:hypothetical protein [Bacteroidales bacterium]
MKYTLILFLFLSGCMTNTKIDLQQDQTVTKHFNKKEIRQLHHILTFFDNEVRILSDTTGSLENNYHAFFNKVSKAAWSGNPYGPVLKIPMQKLNNLFTSLSDTVKNELWVTSRYISPITKDSVSDFDIRSGGKYEAFLKSSSGENKALNKYYKTFEQAHGISPALIVNVILYAKNLNLKRESQRLILAVHYIAIRETGELRKKSNKPVKKRTPQKSDTGNNMKSAVHT